MPDAADMDAAYALAGLPSSPAPKDGKTYIVQASPFSEYAGLSPLVHMPISSATAGSLQGSPAYPGAGVHDHIYSPLPLFSDNALERLVSPVPLLPGAGIIEEKSTGQRRLFVSDPLAEDHTQPSFDDEERSALASSGGSASDKMLIKEEGDSDDEESGENQGMRRALTIHGGRIHPSQTNLATLTQAAQQVDSGTAVLTSNSKRAKVSKRSAIGKSPLKVSMSGHAYVKKFLAESPESDGFQSTPSTPKARHSVAPDLAFETPRAKSDGSDPDRAPCNCKKSKCLKLYCECFAARAYCSGCNCTDCANNVEHEPMRQNAVKATLDRNSDAFKPKIVSSPQVAIDGAAAHSKGCHCRKSNCLKKYCECFLGAVYCNPSICKCVSCKNFIGSSDLKRRRTGEPQAAATYADDSSHCDSPYGSALGTPQQLLRHKKSMPTSNEREKTISGSALKRKLEGANSEDSDIVALPKKYPIKGPLTLMAAAAAMGDHAGSPIRDEFLASA